MKHVLTLTLLLFASIVSQAQEKYTEYDSDGRLRVSGYINKKTGEREGNWITYGKNGLKSSEGNYKNGLKEGKHYSYYDNGNIYVIENYRNDLLDGISLQYHYSDEKNSKRVNSSSLYRNGKREGMSYVYEYDGSIISKRRYENDCQITDTSYTGDRVYYTTRYRIADPTSPTSYYYKSVTESEPYKRPSKNINKSRALSQKRPQSRPKKVQAAAQRTKKQVVLKRTKKQNIPSFIKIQNKPESPKKKKLKESSDGSIRLE